jgi:hypothetical protein
MNGLFAAPTAFDLGGEQLEPLGIRGQNEVSHPASAPPRRFCDETQRLRRAAAQVNPNPPPQCAPTAIPWESEIRFDSWRNPSTQRRGPKDLCGESPSNLTPAVSDEGGSGLPLLGEAGSEPGKVHPSDRHLALGHEDPQPPLTEHRFQDLLAGKRMAPQEIRESIGFGPGSGWFPVPHGSYHRRFTQSGSQEPWSSMESSGGSLAESPANSCSNSSNKSS